MADRLSFAAIAVMVVGAALLAVGNRNLVRGVYWLIVALTGTAILYGFWGASFLAVVQLLTYVGGVAVLMIFGIMVTRRHEGAAIESTGASQFQAALLAVAVFAVLASAIWTTDFSTVTPGTGPAHGGPADIARVLLGDQLLAFEAASAVLLAAIIAAVVLARRTDAAPAAGRGP